MSEAQYICTGYQGRDTALSHYGLGVEFYTHFTSPIRRYADVIVHKQLLEAIMTKTKPSPSPRYAPELSQVSNFSLPESKVISIMKGEALSEFPKPKFVENEVCTENVAVSFGASDPISIANDQLDTNVNNSGGDAPRGLSTPYGTSEVSIICEGLNRHNRLAKVCSADPTNLLVKRTLCY
jgi:hypothetical protein